MQNIYTAGVELPDCSLIGLKARTLFDLSSRAYAVPSLFVVSASVFRRHLCPLLPELQRLYNKQSCDEELSVRAWEFFDTVPLDDRFAAELEACLTTLERTGGGTFAVRSSATLEDSPENTFAGLFETHLRCTGTSEVYCAIRRIWASSFSIPVLRRIRRSSLTVDTNCMAVIVQRYIAPEISGMLTSVDPVSGGCDHLIVEYALNVHSATISGVEPRYRLRVDRLSGTALSLEEAAGNDSDMGIRKHRTAGRLGQPGSRGRLESFPFLPSLIQLDARLQHDFPEGSDIEWVWANNILHVLQRRAPAFRERWEPGALEDVTSSKGRLLHFMKAVGFRVLPMYVLHVLHAELEHLQASALASFASSLGSEHVFISLADSADFEIVSRRDLARQLSLYLDRRGVPRQSQYTFFLEEVHEPQLAGISAVLGAEIHIEVVAGHIQGLTRGLVSPTRYDLSLDGAIQRSEIVEQNMILKLRPHLTVTGVYAFQPFPTQAIRVALDSSQLTRIARMTCAVHHRYVHTQLVWAVSADSLYFFDLHNDPATERNAGHGITISPGGARGPAHLLEAAAFADIAGDKSQYRNRVTDCPDGAILVVDRPYLALAGVLDRAYAFVFRDVSLLCHLAVLLRELRIPAVAAPDVYTSIREGDDIEIREDGMIVVRR